MDRRLFLKSSGLALVAGGFVPRVFVRMASAETPPSSRVLVAVFLRGAVDGLNVVVPYGESAYYSARPTIAVPRPGSREGTALDLDGFFGLHPSLAPLHDLYRSGSAAFVHAAGSPDPTRSHFDAQDFMETGTPGARTTRDGFLARALAAAPRRGDAPAVSQDASRPAPFGSAPRRRDAPAVSQDASRPAPFGSAPRRRDSPVRAVSVTRAMPRILAGADGAVAVDRLERFGLRASGDAQALEAMYGGSDSAPLRAAARESFEALRVLESAAPSRLAPENGAQYPNGEIGRSLKQIAQLIRAGVGLEVAFTDAGGWDTHAGQGASNGQLANRLRDLALAIAAFTRDLGSRMADVTLVTMSEFGRTAAENGNRGTDHGHGNAMMLVGGGVRGGRVYGRWPGLSRDRLYEGRDLAVTTDFRDVFSEVLTARMGLSRDSVGAVFPGWAPKATLGVIG
ncbi:MAG TPA: DUF1501 domain-containing protein [Thermoanaerobaculia bacterium]|nr:DUF1501 domain-containing protein [Thermoanaerobaculia bacterium]